MIKFDEKSGTYYFVYEAGKHPYTGKRKQIRRTGFKNVKDARQSLKQVILETEKNKYADLNMTFEEFATKWLENKKISIQHNTYINTIQNFKNNVYPYIGNIKFKDLNNDVLQEYIKNLSGKQTRNGGIISSHTVHRVWKYVRDVFQKAARRNMFDLMELEGLYLPPLESNINVWNGAEINAFLNASKTNTNLPRTYTAMSISALTAMRQAEVLGLTWKDIDFENRTINIRQTLVLNEGTSRYKIKQRTKTRNSKSSIIIPRRLVTILKEQKKLIQNEIKMAGSNYHKNDLVICTKLGMPISPQSLRRDFQQLVSKLGLPKIRYNDLRHSHATYLISQGVNPKVVQEILRHTNIRTTLGYYSHALPQMHEEAMDKFDLL
ncbi:site-specific integrase [Bacillus sp. Au-Bac7]|uniref:site-specific integrase n=1 Tax=Bacillus sp. Au-Bac7 TaxID=2906458 RepID=UPI001E639835|nr:site-specific integrase [Bacillus sp. Au-Bac7]MCE4051865.1 site-specific integrase [Bacillus sp. Au-Bac7]